MAGVADDGGLVAFGSANANSVVSSNLVSLAGGAVTHLRVLRSIEITDADIAANANQPIKGLVIGLLNADGVSSLVGPVGGSPPAVLTSSTSYSVRRVD